MSMGCAEFMDEYAEWIRELVPLVHDTHIRFSHSNFQPRRDIAWSTSCKSIKLIRMKFLLRDMLENRVWSRVTGDVVLLLREMSIFGTFGSTVSGRERGTPGTTVRGVMIVLLIGAIGDI